LALILRSFSIFNIEVALHDGDMSRDLIKPKCEGAGGALPPVGQPSLLIQEQGVWVYQGEGMNPPLLELIDSEREKRLGELAEPARDGNGWRGNGV